ncbi:MAG: DUF2190 family protein [Phycisphaerae bacterium]|nr:DUF2190 family protein [Phycisphaerae bacterium]
MAKFVHEGKSIDYTPSSAVTAGDVIVLGDLIGIAAIDIPADQLGALTVAGVFDLPKAVGASTAIAAGAMVYWDSADGKAKTDDETGANKYIGKVVNSAIDADITVRVRLSQ